jgi:outer membrane protein assembly factor BamB
MREFTFIATALFLATLYACYRAATHTTDGPTPPMRLSLSGETVGLSCLFLCGFSTVLLSQGSEPGRPQINVADNGNVKFIKHDVFEIAGADQVMSGFAVGGDRLYFGTSTLKLSSQDGCLFCIDRHTGKVHWKFEADDDLQPVFSTPTLADGKIYFGEGLHEHKNCRFFCLDAISGKPAWSDPFKTASHTEGTPLVQNGNVFFTGGDDGLFCADAKTGAKKWQSGGKEKGLHIDGPPAAAGKRVFAGSGLYTNAVFALDAETGSELWRTPVALRSFGPPLVIDDRVVYGLGTGNMLSDTFKYREEGDKLEEKEPAGAVICVEAATGKLAWQFDLPKSVHTSLAADGLYVYAASRDGCVYCLNRKNGKLRWKMPLGITLTAGPAVAADEDGFPIAVYAVTTQGTVACLNPHTGKPFWVRDLNELTGKIVNHVYATPTIVTEGKKRTIYVGALVKNRNNATKTAAVFRFEDELE